MNDSITQLKRYFELAGRLKLKGKARPVFNFLNIIATTDPEETDLDWWTLRLYLRRN